MTIHQSVKASLIEQGFTAAEAKAIIFICLAFERARPFRRYWDGAVGAMPADVSTKFYEQVGAIAEAYRRTFTSKPENALEALGLPPQFARIIRPIPDPLPEGAGFNYKSKRAPD